MLQRAGEGYDKLTNYDFADEQKDVHPYEFSRLNGT